MHLGILMTVFFHFFFGFQQMHNDRILSIRIIQTKAIFLWLRICSMLLSILICRTASVLDTCCLFRANKWTYNDKHKSVNNYIRFRDVELVYLVILLFFFVFDWNARLTWTHFQWKSIKIQFSLLLHFLNRS